MAEIQKDVIKLSERGFFSRLFYAKDDKDTLAAWRSDLNGVLHVFNVSSITSSSTFLTIHFQTELAVNTNVAVSDVRHDVAKTHTIVTDIHRSLVERKEGTDDRNRSVSNHHTIIPH